MKFHSIQFLRFAAALLVAIFHMSREIAQAAQLEPGEAYYLLSSVGRAGVPVFFVVSGFVMYLTSQAYFGKPGASRTFIVRRAIRIYPIYWICAAFYLYYPVTADKSWTISSFLQSILLVPGHASAIIPPGWTLAYEMYFYAVFAIFLSFQRTKAVKLLSLFFVLSVGLGIASDIERIHPIFSVATNFQIFLFLGGVLLGVVALDWKPAICRNRAFLFACFFSSLVGLILAPFLIEKGIPQTFAFGPPSLVLVATVVLLELSGFCPAGIKKLAWLGDSSYALYVIHWFILFHGARLFVSPGTNGGLALAVGSFLVIVCVLVGEFLHHGVEAPMIRSLRRINRALT